jgi:hypothetical protein
VALPEPPSPNSRVLLQAIWDLAYEKSRWPTYGELDRYMDNRHELDAWNVMRETPDVFVRGVGRHSWGAPQDQQDIGLTVAGAAACSGSAETLDVMVAFIRHAAQIHRNWTPPDEEPALLPSLTQDQFAQQLELPEQGRAELCARVGLFLQDEPWGRASWNQPQRGGPWTVSFDRDIKPFRGVVDIEDYWQRRYKPPEWQAEQEPAPDTDAKAADEKAVRLHPDVLPGFLLRWIAAQPGRLTPEPVECKEFDSDVPAQQLVEAVRDLEQRGLVDVIWAAGGTSPSAVPTPAGSLHFQETDRRWNDRRWREPAARDAVMSWIYNRDEDASVDGLPVEHFFLDTHSAVEGRTFSDTDIARACAYLAENGLIDGPTVDQARGPVRVWLTARGIDCMEKRLSVADYLNRPTGGTTNNFFGPVSGTNLAWGDFATQNAVASGIDADGLRTLLQAVIAALPAIGLTGSDRRSVEEAAAELEAAASEPTPNPSRLRRALQSMREGLSAAGKEALPTLLKAAIDHALAGIGWTQNP